MLLSSTTNTITRSKAPVKMTPSRLSLRRNPPSYGSLSSGPRSATGTKFSFHHLIEETPPCSPGLPSIIPRHGKSPPQRRYRPLVRIIFWFLACSILLYYFLFNFKLDTITSNRRLSYSSSRFRVANGEVLPSSPSPVMLEDGKGRRRWTVFIPPTKSFPLKPHVYAEICTKSDIYQKRAPFLDVREAETTGPLPGIRDDTDFAAWTAGKLGDSTISSSLPICEKSLTFLLASTDAGLGSSLLQLWTAYGLAKREGRAFFIDDSTWAYGEYSNYFAPMPAPSCQLPPRHQILPCPRHAKHLLISSSTVSRFLSTSAISGKHSPVSSLSARKTLFSLARTGYLNLFKLRDDDASYAATRLTNLRVSLAPTDGSTVKQGLLVGVHVRHGDRHPLEYQYAHSYIPLDTYISAAQTIIGQTYNGTTDPAVLPQQKASKLVVASDDPDVPSTPEMRAASAEKAQELIVLASKTTLDAAAAAQGRGKTWVDSTVGWEGGFYSEMFFNVGGGGAGAAQLRSFVGRAYMLDLAVLGGADRVVCAVSAAGCRLLGVMMGWDRVVGGEWKNVDGDGGWDGIL